MCILPNLNLMNFIPPLQRTSRCGSSRTPGRGRALSPRLTSTGRWPLCSALRPTATPTSLSRFESKCSSAGPPTARSARRWTSSTCRQTQVSLTSPKNLHDEDLTSLFRVCLSAADEYRLSEKRKRTGDMFLSLKQGPSLASGTSMTHSGTLQQSRDVLYFVGR